MSSDKSIKNDREAIRASINALDVELVRLLADRSRLGETIGSLKASSATPVRDVEREGEVIARAVDVGKSQGLDESFIESLFQLIIDNSLRRQRAGLDARVGDRMLSESRVAYLGGPGSYSHFAAHAHFSGRYSGIEPLICRDYAGIFQSVNSGDADYGFIPIENTTTGGIVEVYDLLRDSNLKIAGERHQVIQHALLSKATDIGSVRAVYGHTQALRQAQLWLNARTDLVKRPIESTTRALEFALDQGPDIAVVAAPEAADLYGLNVIEPNISDFAGNETRFVALAINPKSASGLLPCKTSLVVVTSDEAGALYNALGGFNKSGISLTKLESRPVPGAPWEQLFFLDFEGHEDDETVKKALQILHQCAKTVRSFGSYGSDRLKPATIEG